MLEQSIKSEIHSFKKTSAYINYIYEVSKNDRPELYPKTPTKKVDQNSMDEWKNLVDLNTVNERVNIKEESGDNFRQK